MGKSTISMAMFNSYLKLPEATHHLCVYIYIYIYGNDIYIWLHLDMVIVVITIHPSHHGLIFLAAITEPDFRPAQRFPTQETNGTFEITHT